MATTRAAPTARSQPEQEWLRDLVPLRIQGAIELIDRATHLLRTRIRDMLVVSLSINLPIWLLLALLLRDDWAEGVGGNPMWFWSAILPEPFLYATTTDAASGGTLTWILGRALPSLGLAATGATCGLMVASWARGREMTGYEGLAAMARRAHVFLALWALVHLIEAVTVIGLVLGPVVFGVAMPLCAMEGTSAIGGLARSWRLSMRQFGRCMAVVFLSAMLSVLIGTLVTSGPILFLWMLGGAWIDFGGTAVVALIGAVPHLIIDPLLALSMSLLAIDLKVRVEGADIVAELEELPGAR